MGVRAAVDGIAALGRFGTFCGRVLVRVPRRGWSAAELLRHLENVLFACIGPVLAVMLPFGMVVGLQGLAIFRHYGAERLLPSLVTLLVLRELAPVLASVLVAAQAGSAHAAELGSMRIQEELDATEVMAVDGLSWHVVPRVLAMVLACPLLYVVASAAGVAGAWLTATSLGALTSGTYLAGLFAFSDLGDALGGMAKATAFGLLIGLVSGHAGYGASGGAAGVGRAVNDTVVYSVLAFLALNYVLSSLFFGSVA